MKYRILTGYRIAAVLLPAASVVTWYAWLVVLSPARRVFDPDWVWSHSRSTVYQAASDYVARGNWHTEMAGWIAQDADKQLVEKIFSAVSPDATFSGFTDYTFARLILCYATNHDFGIKAGPWLEWWQNNQDREQKDWLLDGFTQSGITVPVLEAETLTIEQIITFFEILGDIETPSYRRYNLFRYLRELNPANPSAMIQTVLAESYSSRLNDKSIQGLVYYVNRLMHNPPTVGAAGLVNFRGKPEYKPGLLEGEPIPLSGQRWLNHLILALAVSLSVATLTYALIHLSVIRQQLRGQCESAD